MAEAGADNVGMLLDLDDDDRTDIMAEAAKVPEAKKLHLKKIEKALAALAGRAAADVGSAAAPATAAVATAAAVPAEPEAPRGSAGVGCGKIDFELGFGMHLCMTTVDVFQPP